MGALNEYFTLANGTQIPKIGFGTWQIPNADVGEAVKIALKHGYIHIDTAYDYQNETGVGEAVRASGIQRESLFITTKIPASFKSYEKARGAIEESLQKLALGYIDLILIHAPKPWPEMHGSGSRYKEENTQVWKAMEEAYQAGTIKAIGVSNFEIEDLNNLMDNCDIIPMANQIPYHIGLPQKELIAFCKANNILVEGYSPIATGRLLGNAQVAAIAGKYGKSVAQLCIRYVLQNGALPLPKSVHEKYIAQNTDVDFEILAEDMAYLHSLQV